MPSEQSPDEVARKEMDVCGIPDEVILTRAVLLGAVFKSFGPQKDYWGNTSTTIIYMPKDFKQPDTDRNIVGVVGNNEYTLAWRWLKLCYPQALKQEVAP